MTKLQTFGLVAAGVIAYSLFRKASGLGTLNFYPGTVRNIQFVKGSPIMTVGLQVQNTSNQEFILKSIAGNLFLDNYLVGNLANFAAIEIPANGQAIIPLEIKLSLIGLVNKIISAFSEKNYKVDVELDATANVDNIQIPININYKIG